MFWHPVALIPIFLLFAPFPSSGSEVLDAVEVRATKDLRQFHLGGVSAIKAEELESKSSALMNDSLKEVPGVTSAQAGGAGGVPSYFIRGTEARHVSFTIDGLKINDPSNTGRLFDSGYLMSAFLKELILYKGPQAVLFGSDALGGLVDMRTRKGENAPETRLSVNAGSFGTGDASLSQDWGSERSQGTVTWSAFRTDGISRLNKKRFHADERDGAQVHQLSSSSVHAWASRWQTELLSSFLRGQTELDGFTDDNSHDETRSDQYLFQQKTSLEVSEDVSVSLRNGLSRHQRESDTLDSGRVPFAGNLLQHELLMSSEGRAHRILSGTAIEQESLHQTGEEKKADLKSLFIQTSWTAGGWTLLGGLRGEVHSRYGKYHTGSAGLAQATSHGTFGVQYSQGFKAPSLYQLYGRPLFGMPVGNEDLTPEKNGSLEATWRHGPLDVALFRNDLSNLITFTNRGYVNQGHFIAEGMELALDVNFHEFRVRPSATFQSFRHESSPVLRRPTRAFGFHASWFPDESVELFTRVRAFNSRKDFDEKGDLVKLNGFETLALGGKYTWGKNEAGVEVLNLTDRDYEELYGYSVMPRSFVGHLARKF